MKLTREGEEFIVSEETGGKNYYEKRIKETFEWPGGASGCTAMVGIDIGYYTEQEVNNIFAGLVKPDELALIQKGRGLIRSDAKQYVAKLQKIVFPWDTAIQTFERCTLPKFLTLTERAYPGVAELCEYAQTAIVSLVFNRGVAMKGDTRREMLNIRRLVQSKDYMGIAKEIRSMKRLWEKGNGLLGRRDREAALVEKCAS